MAVLPLQTSIREGLLALRKAASDRHLRPKTRHKIVLFVSGAPGYSCPSSPQCHISDIKSCPWFTSSLQRERQGLCSITATAARSNSAENRRKSPSSDRLNGGNSFQLLQSGPARSGPGLGTSVSDALRRRSIVTRAVDGPFGRRASRPGVKRLK